VKKFAAEMIKAHTATSAGLKAALAKSGVDVTLPTQLDERHQGLVDNLKTTSAADFDKVYIDQQVAAHKEALDLMQTYGDHGGNVALKAAAVETAPKVKAHLDMAQKMQDGAHS
jgi:putative membrane protein